MWKKHLPLWTAIAVAILCTQPAGAAASSAYLANSLWDNGQAEFCVYEASIARYGSPRKASVKMILVKEGFDPEKSVKTSGKEDAIEVVKLHTIQKVPTGIYDYFQTTSIFFERATGKTLKYTMSSQDGCGNTFMQFLAGPSRGTFQFHSYWDDVGDMTMEREDEGAVFYEALPLVLRTRLEEGATYGIRLIPSLVSNKVVNPDPVDSTVTVVKRNGRDRGIPDRPELFEATVTTAETRDIFLFEPAFPNRLMQWEKGNGDRLVLKKAYNIDYWNRTGDVDRVLQELE